MGGHLRVPSGASPIGGALVVCREYGEQMVVVFEGWSVVRPEPTSQHTFRVKATHVTHVERDSLEVTCPMRPLKLVSGSI